jgi:hypothetical protein
MRLALIAYFDIGTSFGLSDNVFASNQLGPEIDIGLIGFRNPLGRGILLNLAEAAPKLVENWRRAAAEQVRRPGMETGWSQESKISRDVFDDTLTSHALQHPLRRCELTIFAIGIVFIRLEFEAGIKLEFLDGVSQCFEFAAYTPPIARALHEAARSHIGKALETKRTGLEALLERNLPEPVTDKKKL